VAQGGEGPLEVRQLVPLLLLGRYAVQRRKIVLADLAYSAATAPQSVEVIARDL
jgi:hypothetical protein